MYAIVLRPFSISTTSSPFPDESDIYTHCRYYIIYYLKLYKITFVGEIWLLHLTMTTTPIVRNSSIFRQTCAICGTPPSSSGLATSGRTLANRNINSGTHMTCRRQRAAVKFLLSTVVI